MIAAEDRYLAALGWLTLTVQDDDYRFELLEVDLEDPIYLTSALTDILLSVLENLPGVDAVEVIERWRREELESLADNGASARSHTV